MQNTDENTAASMQYGKEHAPIAWVTSTSRDPDFAEHFLRMFNFTDEDLERDSKDGVYEGQERPKIMKAEYYEKPPTYKWYVTEFVVVSTKIVTDFKVLMESVMPLLDDHHMRLKFDID